MAVAKELQCARVHCCGNIARERESDVWIRPTEGFNQPTKHVPKGMGEDVDVRRKEDDTKAVCLCLNV